MVVVEDCMMGTMVVSEEASAAAGRRISELLDRKQATEAIAFAEDCEGPQQITDQLRAIAYTHGGAMMQDRARLERAVALWRRAGAETNSHMGYNLANAELDVWYLLVHERGYVAALQDDRVHLRDARALLRRAGVDESVPEDTRVQALTNLGNSYDSEGRDMEAIAALRRSARAQPELRHGAREQGDGVGIRRAVRGPAPAHGAGGSGDGI